MDAMDEASVGITIEDNIEQQTQKKRHSERTTLLEKILPDGSHKKANPLDTTWYHMYVSHPMIRCLKFNRKFRQRFRLPYDKFLELVAQAREERWFPR
jgi:hypothetical protein